MATALKNTNAELTAWPGTAFSLETDEGRALLGSPNGLSFGYFLISHKAKLGQKWIPKVQISIADGDEDVDFASPAMLFYVEKSPDKKPKEAADSGPWKEMLERRVGPRNIVRVHRRMEEIKAKL